LWLAEQDVEIIRTGTGRVYRRGFFFSKKFQAIDLARQFT
jgi:hypothetical protein